MNDKISNIYNIKHIISTIPYTKIPSQTLNFNQNFPQKPKPTTFIPPNPFITHYFHSRTRLLYAFNSPPDLAPQEYPALPQKRPKFTVQHKILHIRGTHAFEFIVSTIQGLSESLGPDGMLCARANGSGYLDARPNFRGTTTALK